ncbi:hypothetical protein L1987_18653 [Smallanthus sonchifolius]|uniref:Uncharacterized protein n=1 Tax=Smallanthus sonchifolius TaxID=185202 RepID=A0ACB9J2K1_9ASTR|nr:hypothetical protein L1987_18653 [Smallanthus sonchifolius]
MLSLNNYQWVRYFHGSHHSPADLRSCSSAGTTVFSLGSVRAQEISTLVSIIYREGSKAQIRLDFHINRKRTCLRFFFTSH